MNCSVATLTQEGAETTQVINHKKAKLLIKVKLTSNEEHDTEFLNTGEPKHLAVKHIQVLCLLLWSNQTPAGPSSSGPCCPDGELWPTPGP